MGNTFLNKNSFPLNQKETIPSMRFKLFGRWAEAIRLTQTMGPKVKIASIYAQRKVCKDIEARVKKHLVNQDLGWKRLSPDTAYYKNKEGLDSRTLIAYGNYYHAIETWISGTSHFMYVGVKKGKYTYNYKTRKRSRLDLSKIATIHEFSTGRRLPKRPLWNPTIREVGGAQGIKGDYIKHLLGKARSMGLPIKEIKKIWL